MYKIYSLTFILLISTAFSDVDNNAGSGALFSFSKNVCCINIDGQTYELWPVSDTLNSQPSELIHLSEDISFSVDGSYLGSKVVYENGLQAPIIINFKTGDGHLLHEPCPLAGRTTFSNDGKSAFTVGDTLFVIKNGLTTKYDLRNYVHNAPLSPDGNFMAYNDEYDQICILNLRTNERKIISEPGNACFNPVWSPDSKKLIYKTLNMASYCYDINNNGNFNPEKEVNEGFEPLRPGIDTFAVDSGNYFYCPITSPLKRQNLKNVDKKLSEAYPDIPYLHQVYDTPAWFNGHWACGPTTAMMVLAYYNILPEWECECPNPSPGHTSKWGRYIAEKYEYNEITYNITADDPSGNPSQGAFGYFWSGENRPYYKMAEYYENHGFESETIDNPSYAYVCDRLDAGELYSICVQLGTNGHLILAHSKGEKERTFVFNDPYGDRNTPGYPTYDGKNVKYDWPGYDNGNANLGSVYWGTSHSIEKKENSDTLVDDLDFGGGFYLHTAEPSSMRYWHDINSGYEGHAWFTYSTAESVLDTCSAIWTPELNKSGKYQIDAFIPEPAESKAIYRVFYNGVYDSIYVDQAEFAGQWLTLGKFEMDSAKETYVRLGDACGEGVKKMYFDAMRWTFIPEPNKVDNDKNNCAIDIYPNPADDFIEIKTNPDMAVIENIEICGINGQAISSYNKTQLANGAVKKINTSRMNSGVYILRIIANGEIFDRKFIIER